VGEKDTAAAGRTAAQGIVLGLAIAAAIGVAGAALAPQLMRTMGASEAVVATGSGFTRVMLGCNASVFLLFLINAVFRGAGDAALAMRRAVDRQPAQHRARAVLHLRHRAVPGASASPAPPWRPASAAAPRSSIS